MKIQLTILSLSALSLFSCGGNLQHATIQTTENQSVEKKSGEFLTQDLRMYNFFGKVRTFKTVYYDCGENKEPLPCFEGPYEDYFSLEYDENGRFKTEVMPAFTLESVKKKDGGKILEAEQLIEEFDQKISAAWTYNADNQVQKLVFNGIENKSETEYFYNSDGELTKETSVSFAEGQGFKDKTYYEIMKRDSAGNWIERFAKIESEQCSWDSDKKQYGEYKKQENRYTIQKREISYY
jgi:hypothetical protein